MPTAGKAGGPDRGAPLESATWAAFLQARARDFGIEVTAAQVAAFERYLVALLDWNRRVNLTAVTDPDQVAALHFLDSLTCLAAAPVPRGAALADIGAGAGLPGIPLAIVRPDLCVTLIESVGRKCRFLEHVVAAIGLPAEVYCGRAETAGRDPSLRERFDVAVLRAVAETAVGAELCLPLVRVGGLALMMKGPRADEEIARARVAISRLGGELEFVREFALPLPQGAAQRSIIGLRKVAPTPEGYPRAPGRPAKRPLG